MFVLTTVTRDCKNGDLYVSVDDNAYLTKEAASTALRARYEDFLKSMKLEDNGASDENGNAMPGGYCISDEASIYDYTAMRPSFSTTTTGLFSWQSIAMGRFFLLERIGPHGSANFLYSPLNIFAAHLRMGGIFV